MSSFLIFVFLTDKSDKKEQLFSAEMKLRSAACDQLISGWTSQELGILGISKFSYWKQKKKAKQNYMCYI